MEPKLEKERLFIDAFTGIERSKLQTFLEAALDKGSFNSIQYSVFTGDRVTLQGVALRVYDLLCNNDIRLKQFHAAAVKMDLEKKFFQVNWLLDTPTQVNKPNPAMNNGNRGSEFREVIFKLGIELSDDDWKPHWVNFVGMKGHTVYKGTSSTVKYWGDFTAILEQYCLIDELHVSTLFEFLIFINRQELIPIVTRYEKKWIDTHVNRTILYGPSAIEDQPKKAKKAKSEKKVLVKYQPKGEYPQQHITTVATSRSMTEFLDDIIALFYPTDATRMKGLGVFSLQYFDPDFNEQVSLTDLKSIEDIQNPKLFLLYKPIDLASTVLFMDNDGYAMA